jgi:hypothetical protein
MTLKFYPILLAICASTSTLLPQCAYALGPVTFEFSGFIEFQQRGPVQGLEVGKTFHGSFTFDPLAAGTPHTPADNSLDADYGAILSWNVVVPGSGLTFQGTVGTVSVGNDTPFFASDRYIVSMYRDANQPPIMVDGHQFGLFQIDLFSYGFGTNATLLGSSALPVTPPSLIPDDGNFYQRRGRFVFTDASFQNRMTSLNVVPEPAVGTLIVGGMAMLVLLRPTRPPKPHR